MKLEDLYEGDILVGNLAEAQKDALHITTFSYTTKLGTYKRYFRYAKSREEHNVDFKKIESNLRTWSLFTLDPVTIER